MLGQRQSTVYVLGERERGGKVSRKPRSEQEVNTRLKPFKRGGCPRKRSMQLKRQGVNP